MPGGASPTYPTVPSMILARHEAQWPPLQLCGRLRPARSAAASTVSPVSAVNDWPVGMSVTCGIRTGCHEASAVAGHVAAFAYPWPMDHRCFIAGCGYVGRRLAERLRPAWRVVALARSPGSVATLRAAGIETIDADLDAPRLPGELQAAADGAAIAYLAPPQDTGTDDTRLGRFLDALGEARP